MPSDPVKCALCGASPEPTKCPGSDLEHFCPKWTKGTPFAWTTEEWNALDAAIAAKVEEAVDAYADAVEDRSTSADWEDPRAWREREAAARAALLAAHRREVEEASNHDNCTAEVERLRTEVCRLKEAMHRRNAAAAERVEAQRLLLGAASKFAEACHRRECYPRDDTSRFRADLRLAALAPEEPEAPTEETT